MWALDEAPTAEMGDPPPGFRLTITQDRDHPNRYATIVEFPSYEVAMENSQRPDTDAFARQMAALCSSGRHFRNLEVQGYCVVGLALVVVGFPVVRAVMRSCGRWLASRVASAMLVAPLTWWYPMEVLRRVANTAGPLPVRA
jgi:hypothetical protein